MPQLTYPQVVRPSALLDALYAALPALQPAVNPTTGEREMRVQLLYWPAHDEEPPLVVLTVPEGTSVSAVDAVLSAHDPEQPSAGEQQAEQDALDLSQYRDQYEAMLQARATIDGHMDAILAGPASPTAAQVGTALKTIAGDIKRITEGMERLLRAVRVLAERQAGDAP